LVGDANLSEWAQVLRVGATALVLEAIESKVEVDWPVLKQPLDALRRLNRDPELRVELELVDGSRASALEIQNRYLRGVRHALGEEPLEGWKQRVMGYWEETLDALASDPERSSTDEGLRDLAFRAWRVDLRYHELSPRGGYRRLEARGLMRRLTDPARVARARLAPPDDTRAWARGHAIKWAHAQAVSGRAAWHRVRVGKFDWRFFPDPLDSQRGGE
jgi:proteasome accessory factor A